MRYNLGTHNLEYWLGIKYNKYTEQFLWINGSGEGLWFSSNWWYKGSHIEPNGSGKCVNSYGRVNEFLLRDIGCDTEASYICERI